MTDMDITLLLQSFMGLIVILATLIFLLFYSRRAKSKRYEKRVVAKPDTRIEVELTLESLVAVVKNKKTSTKELQETLDLVLKYYGVIHKKLGTRTHPDFDIYMNILFTICRHPNTNKNIIIGFDKALIKLNPEYKPDINDAITKGLNSRGV